CQFDESTRRLKC
nr:Chain E, L5E meditope variant [synthetic construct]5ETU_F Chain F, L5E meditope variant [synthetic construct]